MQSSATLITSLVYSRFPGIEFADLVDELDTALGGTGRWDGETNAIFEVEGSRVVVGFEDHRPQPDAYRKLTLGAEATLVLSLHPTPEPVRGPITLRWCQTMLAVQPALAGHKHLNRLENVLARREWRDPGIFEGLMRDTDGRVVSATAANLFARIGGRWRTPPVHRCGIAGIARGWLLAHLDGVEESDIHSGELAGAEALFLCNSVRGILPVARLEQRLWPDDPGIAGIQSRLAEAEPAFSI